MHATLPVHLKYMSMILPIEFGKHFPGCLQHVDDWGTTVTSPITEFLPRSGNIGPDSLFWAESLD